MNDPHFLASLPPSPMAETGHFVLVDGRLDQCDRGTAAILQRSIADLQGMDPVSLSPRRQPDGSASAAVWRQRLQAAAELPQSFEWHFGDADRAVHTLISLAPVEQSGRSVLQGRLQHLGDLYRAEAAWRESETRLSQILDNTTAVVYVKDRQGIYLLANRQFERLFDLPASRVIGRTDAELGVFDSETARILRGNDDQVLTRAAPIEYEESVTIGGAERVFLSIKFPLFNTDDEPYAVCGISTDITERKRTETALTNVALGVSGANSDDVFQAIAYYLTRSLEVDFAFIGELMEGSSRRMKTLATCHRGEIGENIEYDLAGTPCQTVVGQSFRFIPEGLLALYPGDNMLHDFGFDGYAGYPLFDSTGRPLGLIAVVSRAGLAQRELTESILRIFSVRAAAEIERLHTDTALRQSEASYRGLFEAAEDSVFVHDIDTGEIVDVNPRACEIYGYSREQMLHIGLDRISAGHPPYTEAEARAWLERARSGRTQRFEWQRRNRDGSLHWDEVTLKRVTIAGVDRILASTREITERKTREQALRTSENRLRATVDTALDCIIGMDIDGRITEFNPAAEACFGCRREQVLGRLLAEVMIPPRDREAHRRGLQRYCREGAGPFLGQRVEVTAMRADGSEFPAELAITVARGEAGDTFIGYLRDITRSKQVEAARAQLEAQLRQAQKMEAIGHLSGGVAHDFNNILTGIMGYITLAEERGEAIEDPKLVRYLERARQSGERARDLIRQLLTFSRGQRGEARPVELRPLIHDTLRLLRSVVPSSVEFALDLDGRIPPVMLDPVQVEQILMNLCINARDAMEGRGRIVIGLHRTALPRSVCSSCRQPLEGEFVELCVTDAGPGIAPAHLDRIFEPFFSTKETGKGSGMGLATIHGILHEAAAHVLVETELGVGSRFRLLFPALEAVHGAAPGIPAPAQGGSGMDSLKGHVLLVDDDDAAGDFMEDLLGEWGLQVSRARDGREALERFQQPDAAFDLVLLDQTMPRMTGLEAARHILASGASVPVLLYTGYSDSITEADVAAAGLRGLLHKPVDTQQLHDWLEDLL